MYIVIVVGGALFIKAGRLSAADFMAYLLYANVLLNSIRRIVEFTEQFQRGMTGIDRFLEIMDAPAEDCGRAEREGADGCPGQSARSTTFPSTIRTMTPRSSTT